MFSVCGINMVSMYNLGRNNKCFDYREYHVPYKGGMYLEYQWKGLWTNIRIIRVFNMMCPGEGKNTTTCYNVRQKVFNVWLSIIKNYEAGYPIFRPEL